MTTIYLIRHAEAEGNLYRRVHGQYDSLITDRGIKQIEKLAERFADIRLDAVYSSDLNRAKQTARALAGQKKLPLITVPGLREVAMGEWEDKCWGELEELYSEQLYYYNASPDKWNISGGENFFVLRNRVFSALRNIAAQNPERTVAAVSHGGAIRAFLSGVMNIEPCDINRIYYCDNTAVTLLNYHKGKFTIEFTGDCDHLPDYLTSFRRESWWKTKNGTDGRNMRFLPMNLKKEGKAYLSSYEDSWILAHGTRSGFSNIYLDWAKSRAKKDPEQIARAYLTGNPCGIVELAGETVERGNSGHIAFLYISEQYRGRGLAVQLLGYAVSYYRKIGRDKLRLHVAESNSRALTFYRKYGFNLVESENGTHGKTLIMEKDIKKP